MNVPSSESCCSVPSAKKCSSLTDTSSEADTLTTACSPVRTSFLLRFIVISGPFVSGTQFTVYETVLIFPELSQASAVNTYFPSAEGVNV